MKRFAFLLVLAGILCFVLTAAAQNYYDDSYYDEYWYADGWSGQWTDNDPNSYSWGGQEYQYDWSSPDYVPDPSDNTGWSWDGGDWNDTGANADQWMTGETGIDDWNQMFTYSLDDWFWTGTLPDYGIVDNFVGYPQSYTLDCETRSAVDLAAFFNVRIDHGQFLNSLPKSDDPNEGFVGYYNDPRGKIPPASYGVYQEPVADLLRSYGLNAVGVVGFTDDALKYQISRGKPVMVWVIGNTEVGTPVSYTPSNGRTTTVAAYQHTVVVIGYDKENVTLQDGGLKYQRSWNTFDKSWGVLNNRAIYVK